MEVPLHLKLNPNSFPYPGMPQDENCLSLWPQSAPSSQAPTSLTFLFLWIPWAHASSGPWPFLLPLSRMLGLRLLEAGSFLSFRFYFKHWLSLQHGLTHSLLTTCFPIIPLYIPHVLSKTIYACLWSAPPPDNINFRASRQCPDSLSAASPRAWHDFCAQ